MQVGIAAWAYEHDQYWLADMIDIAKGTGHCENEWDKKLQKEKDKRKEKEDEDRGSKGTGV